MISFGAVAAVALSLSGSGPAAQQAEPDIVVQGNRNFEQDVSDFVSVVAPGSNRSQLKRFEERICPRAFGLQEAHARLVVSRIRKVAAEAGIPQAGRNCVANILVFVTPDKRKFMAALHRLHPSIFPDGWSSWHVESVINSATPVEVWQFEDAVWYDGRRMRGVAAGRTKYEDESKLTSTSRIRPSSRRAVSAAFMVVQADALAGITPTQLADYAAMRTLSQAKDGSVAALPRDSILGIFGAPPNSAIPASLTAWDLNYLRALYKSDNNQYAGAQRSSIKRLMKDTLAKK